MRSYDVDWKSTQHATEKRAQRIWRAAYVFGVVACVAAVGFVIFRSPILRVRAVHVTGVSHISHDEVIAAIKDGSPAWRRVFGFEHLWGWSEDVASVTRERLPSIEHLTLTRHYLSRSVSIVAEERDPLGIWCFSKSERPSCFWFDRSGVAYQEAFVSEGSLVPVVRDAAQDTYGDDRLVLHGEPLERFMRVMSVLESEDIAVREVRLQDLDKQELDVTTYTGPTLLLSLRFDPHAMQSVIAKLRAKGTFASLQYVDFRSENRAFYQ